MSRNVSEWLQFTPVERWWTCAAEERSPAAAGVEFSPFGGVTNLLNRDYNTSVVVNAFGGRYYEPGLYAGLRMQPGAARR